jgi:hypothetical protein
MSELEAPPELRSLLVREFGREPVVVPYGRQIGAWLAAAHESASADSPIVAIVPARTDTRWWWNYCRQHEVRFLRGRLRFAGAKSGAPFPSAVVVFGRRARSRWWDWRKGEYRERAA